MKCSTSCHCSHSVRGKSCLAQYFSCEAITAAESSYQSTSVSSLLFPVSSTRSSYFPAPFMNPALPRLCICSAISPSLSFSAVRLCPSVCLYTLTLSSLPSQHCSSWLPESQPPLSIPLSSRYHPLNEVR